MKLVIFGLRLSSWGHGHACELINDFVVLFDSIADAKKISS
jgi:hypothetical protein